VMVAMAIPSSDCDKVCPSNATQARAVHGSSAFALAATPGLLPWVPAFAGKKNKKIVEKIVAIARRG
jgi:hypothetical protein